MGLVKELGEQITKLQGRLRSRDKRLAEMLTIKNTNGKFEVEWAPEFYEQYHGPLYEAMEKYKKKLEKECERFRV